MMHGRILVDSKPGEGSTFTVELPATVTADPADVLRTVNARKTPTDTSLSRPIGDTVLVIDDDASVRDIMTRYLGRLGYDAISAASGEEGLRLASELRPSIITLDVTMPGLSGWDVLEELKVNPELSSIPVIMLTIMDSEALALSKGASDYLVKPIDRDRLAAVLEKHSSRQPSEEGDMELANSRRG
jgi:DNA-binding response OmpR family regulator